MSAVSVMDQPFSKATGGVARIKFSVAEEVVPGRKVSRNTRNPDLPARKLRCSEGRADNSKGVGHGDECHNAALFKGFCRQKEGARSTVNNAFRQIAGRALPHQSISSKSTRPDMR